MAYRIDFQARFDREFAQLDNKLQLRVLQRIGCLIEEPRGQGTRKLNGFVDLWRVRVGDYRVAYRLLDEAELLQFVSVGHRREFYRRLNRLPDLR